MLLAAALTALALTAPAPGVCIVGIPLEKVESEYGLIFEGTVTYIPGEVVLETTELARGLVEWKGLRLWFKVDRVFKGTTGTDVEITYTHHAGQYQGRFNEEERFIVWAYQRNGRWGSDDCAPTVERILAPPEMLAFLDRLKK